MWDSERKRGNFTEWSRRKMFVQVENRKMMAFRVAKFQQGDDPLYETKIYE